MNKRDLEHLERSMRTLQGALGELSRQDDLEELIPLWRRPGWTTPAEFLLVQGTLDSMVTIAEHLGVMKRTLIEGSRQVAIDG
jgi:hypothetical protein